MKSIATILLTVSFTILFPGCSKNEEPGRRILKKGLRGMIMYKSCATTAVQVLNKDFGDEWTNCFDKRIYDHIIDANIVNQNDIKEFEEFNFNIVEDEPAFRCDMIDCKPPRLVTIVITGK